MDKQGNMRMRTITVAGLALICWAGTAMAQYAGPSVTSSGATASAPASAMHLQQAEAAILPGDGLSIATYGVPELSTSGAGSIPTSGPGGLRVSADGTVTLPYLGTVKLAGLTPSQAAQYLARQLKAAGILVDPQVTVQVVSSAAAGITVVGEVKEAKPVPVYGAQMRLLDVISACGGFTNLASHTVTVHRVGDPTPITVNLGVDPATTDVANIPLVAGDTVVVPRVGNAYVVGDVIRPQAIPLANNAPITVLQAISMSGGVDSGAALSKAMVIRTTPDQQRVEILFDLKKVMHGKEKDIALTADDILFIPSNAFKTAVTKGNPAQTSLYAAVASATLLK